MPELPNLPPIADAALSVVLLARDDADHLEAVVGRWVEFLNGLGREYELILVEDGSRDGSAQCVEATAQRHPNLRVVQHPYPAGAGVALAAGLGAARFPLVCYVRCEPRYQPADLRKLLQEIDKVHLVSGYRAGQPMPRGWRLLGTIYRAASKVVLGSAPARLPGWLGWRRHLGRLLVRILFGVRCHDVACPYRLLRRDILARMPVQSVGSFAHVELLAKANFLGHLLAEEVPLGDRQRPVRPEESREPFRLARADFWRLLKHPDFGPARLESATVAGTEDQPALEPAALGVEQTPSS